MRDKKVLILIDSILLLGVWLLSLLITQDFPFCMGLAVGLSTIFVLKTINNLGMFGDKEERDDV